MRISDWSSDVCSSDLDLTLEEQATIEALTAEQARLEAEYQDADELPDEIDARMGEIETALAAFDDRSAQFDPADIAIAGVFVSIDRSEEHTSELQSLMRISYAVFCLKKKNTKAYTD